MMVKPRNPVTTGYKNIGPRLRQPCAAPASSRRKRRNSFGRMETLSSSMSCRDRRVRPIYHQRQSGMKNLGWTFREAFGSRTRDTVSFIPKWWNTSSRNLASASGGDKRKPLVFYCLRNCWMSWNAAKRAVELGYDSVIWFPDGTDGWSQAGLPLSESEPRPWP